ncbi:hypothetical protein BgiBS90_032982 [Biomphalaria glabrata]|nr:hypothetical protein BgiBS90_032982 [Biomphalaria glabrata]
MTHLCDSAELTLTHFRRYSYFSFEDYSFTSSKSPLQCALLCNSSADCAGVILDPACYHLDRRLVTSLDFNTRPGNDVLVRRQIVLENLDVDPISLSTYYEVALVSRMQIGDILCLQGVLLAHDDVRVILYQNKDLQNEAVHLRAGCYDVKCYKKRVLIKSKFMNAWSPISYENFTAYTLQLDTTFAVHILVTANGIKTYLNGVYLYTSNPNMSISNVNYIQIGGSTKIKEFSV